MSKRSDVPKTPGSELLTVTFTCRATTAAESPRMPRGLTMGKREKVEKKVDEVKDTVNDAAKAAEGMTGAEKVVETKPASSRRVLNPGTEVELIDLKGGSLGQGTGVMAMAAVGGTGVDAASSSYERSVGPAPARRVGLGAVDRLVEREENDINFRAATASRVLLDHEAELFADKDQSVQAAVDSHKIWTQTDTGSSVRHPNHRAEVGMVTSEKAIFINGQVVNHPNEVCADLMYPTSTFGVVEGVVGWHDVGGNPLAPIGGLRSNFLLRGITVKHQDNKITDVIFETVALPSEAEPEVVDQLPDHNRVAYNEAIEATTIKMRDLVEDPANIDKNLYSPLATGFPNTNRVQRLKQDIEMTDGALVMLGLRTYGNAVSVMKRMRQVFGSDHRAHGGFCLTGRPTHAPTVSDTGIVDSAQYENAFTQILADGLNAAERLAVMGPVEYVFHQDSRNKYNSFGAYLVQPRGVLMRLKHGMTAMSKLTFRCDKQFVTMVQKTLALAGDGRDQPMMGVTGMVPIIPYNPSDWFYYDEIDCKLRGKVQLADNVMHGTYGTYQEIVSPLFQSIVDVLVNELFYGMIRSRIISSGAQEASFYIPLDFDATKFTFAQQLIAHSLQYYPHRRDAAMAMWDAFEQSYGVNPLDMSEQITRISTSDIFEGSNFTDLGSPFKEKPLDKVLEIMMMDPEDVKYAVITSEDLGVNSHSTGVLAHWSRGVQLTDPTAQYAGGEVEPFNFRHFTMNWPMLRRNLVAPILDKLFSIAPSEYRSTFDKPVKMPVRKQIDPLGTGWEDNEEDIVCRELLAHDFIWPHYTTAPHCMMTTGGDTSSWRWVVTVGDILCTPRTKGRLAPLPPVKLDAEFSPELVVSFMTRSYSLVGGSSFSYFDVPIERYEIMVATTRPATASPTGAATAKIVRVINSTAATLTDQPRPPPAADALIDFIEDTGYTIARIPTGNIRDRVFVLADDLPIAGANDAQFYQADSMDYYFSLLNYVPWLVNPFQRGVDLFDDQVVAGKAARIYTDDEMYYLFGLAGYTRSDWSKAAERIYGEKVQIYNEIADKRYETNENLWFK